MKYYVQFLKKSILSFGSSSKKLSHGELKNFNKMRRSYYFLKSKKKGDRVEADDVIYLRPKLKIKKTRSQNTTLVKNYLKGDYSNSMCELLDILQYKRNFKNN